MTHEYTLLVGGVVIAGGGRPDAQALAWALDTVLAIGSVEEVDAISRGDSTRIDLLGRVVAPLAGVLEVGAPADLAVYAEDPRTTVAHLEPVAVVRAGAVVAGDLGGEHSRNDTCASTADQ